MAENKRARNLLRRLRRDLETFLSHRHTLEQLRFEMDNLAYRTGNVALAELTEKQAEVLEKTKLLWAHCWQVVNTEINEGEQQ